MSGKTAAEEIVLMSRKKLSLAKLHVLIGSLMAAHGAPLALFFGCAQIRIDDAGVFCQTGCFAL